MQAGVSGFKTITNVQWGIYIWVTSTIVRDYKEDYKTALALSGEKQ